MKLPRWFIGPARELKRPSFPVQDKYLEIRGDVNAVKPLFRKRSKPVDYAELGAIW